MGSGEREILSDILFFLLSKTKKRTENYICHESFIRESFDDFLPVDFYVEYLKWAASKSKVASHLHILFTSKYLVEDV